MLTTTTTVRRLLDLLGAILGIGLLLPLMPWIVLALLFENAGPILVRLPRVGALGRSARFRQFRFRVTGIRGRWLGCPTPVGKALQRLRLDGMPQLLNVLLGQMSLVGPRPQVPKDVEIYTDVERELLLVRPGMTDLSSIVFSDEAEILKGRQDPDAAYNYLIRPWKSRLGLLYVAHRSLRLDLRIILITGLSVISRRSALDSVQHVLQTIDADAPVRHVARREQALEPYSPPGAS